MKTKATIVLKTFATIVAFGICQITRGDENDMEKFKSFIESPPVITSIVYEHYYPRQTNFLNRQYYFARWQPNAFIRIESPIKDNVINPHDTTIFWNASIDCYCENIWWKLDGSQRELMTWDQSVNSDSANNPVDRSISASLRDFSYLLNMGIEHANVASIQWMQNAFNYTNNIDGNIWHMTGKVFEDLNGRAKQINLDLTLFDKTYTKPRNFKWIIDYFYEEKLSLEYLPSRIRTRSVRNGEDKVLDEYKIDILEISNKPMAKLFFAPEQFMLRASPVYVVTNKTVMYVTEGGWRTRMTADDPRIISNVNHKAHRVIYALLCIVLFSPLLILKLMGTKRLKK